ncbi:MAG: hypothetical protein ACKO96_47800, partial [Flammeovirgaceae bacterium]
MKEEFGCLNENDNLEKLFLNEGDVLICARELNPETFLKKTNESLFAKGFTNSDLNLELLKNERSFDESRLMMSLKFQYDQKFRE